MYVIPYRRTNSWNTLRRLGSNKCTGSGSGVYAQRALQAQGQWYNGYEKKPLTVTYSGPEHLNVPQPITNPPKLQVYIINLYHLYTWPPKLTFRVYLTALPTHEDAESHE